MRGRDERTDNGASMYWWPTWCVCALPFLRLFKEEKGQTATRFMRESDAAVDPTQRFQLTTDGLNVCPTAVGNILGLRGESVDYAQPNENLLDGRS